MAPRETVAVETSNNDTSSEATNMAKETMAAANQEGSYTSTRQSPENDPILKAMFVLMVYLCVGMFIWIVFLPASWLFSRSQFHREVTLPWLDRIGFFWILPYSLMTKFKGYTFVEFTHILPGALWVAMIPFQLHPTFRKNHRRIHRFMGYLFVATSLSIGGAIFVLQYQRLTYDYHPPFDKLPPRFADTFQIPMTWLVTFWFCGTGVQSVRMAREGKFQQHEAYMLRHVAAGLWVSTQRMIIFPTVQLVLGRCMDEVSDWLRRELFGGTANAAMVITALLAEFAIHRIANLRSQQSATAIAKKLN